MQLLNLRQMRYFSLLAFVLCCIANAATVDTVKIKSNIMNKEISALVVIPENSGESPAGFPTVYLLHGFGGSYLDWSKNANLEEFVDEYSFILVCPDGSADSWYLDSPLVKSSQYETFIANELIRWTDSTYPTIARKSGRAITGLSMGGHGSFYLAMRHPEKYIAAGNMSGVVDLTQTTQRLRLGEKLGNLEKFPERWRQHSVINLVDRIKNKNIGLLIDCGVDDVFIDSNRQLHQRMLELNIDHVYIERPGQHNWQYWSRVLEYHLLFFQVFFESSEK